MTAAFKDAVRMVKEALDSILEFEDVCDRGSDSGGWQSEELEAAFKKVAAARAVLPFLLQWAVGFRLVPEEITLEMQKAYFDVIDRNMERVSTDPRFGRFSNNQEAYRAMLAAAPLPTSPKQEGE